MAMGKLQSAMGEALKNTLFSQIWLIILIAIDMTFNHQHCTTRNTVRKSHESDCLHLFLFLFV